MRVAALQSAEIVLLLIFLEVVAAANSPKHIFRKELFYS